MLAGLRNTEKTGDKKTAKGEDRDRGPADREQLTDKEQPAGNTKEIREKQALEESRKQRRNTMTEAQVQECQKKRDNADPWVRLAWDTITAYVTDKNVIPVPKNLPEALYKEQAGAFVSIHKLGELRGCIGTIAPVMPSLAEEIIRNAICAATQDPRFYPIAAKELPFLDISVDVLGAPEPISSKSELDIKRYGVIVTCGGRRGLLLPDLEGVESVDHQIFIACRKAGIDPSEHYALQRFEVIRHY